MDKAILKQTMLSLEGDALQHAKHKYLDFVASARLDRSEPIESGQQAQAELASDLSEAFDHPIHTISDKIAALKKIDFSSKSTVEPGAVVKIAGRHFVVSVSTDQFCCDGNDYMGISTQAPVYKILEGKGTGDCCSFNGRDLRIEEIF